MPDKKITQPLRKILIVSISLLSAALIGCTDQSGNHANPSLFVKDSASSDTPVETLKTLTADISAVKQQNQQLAAKNKRLMQQNKTSIEQFKKDMQLEVDQQITRVKTDLQQSAPSLVNSVNSAKTNTAAGNTYSNNGMIDASATTTDANGLTWVNDLQNMAGIAGAKNLSTDHRLASLLNPALTEKNIAENNPTLKLTAPPNAGFLAKNQPPAIPYYTLPVNATLTGAIAMQPLIGRIPLDGKVSDPYTFKAIIGAKNLAANGVDIPLAIQGIMVSGVAEGDMLGKCARGDVTALTFVFADGRISTMQTKAGQALGTIAAANGNPCIAGSFHTNAGVYLGVTAGLAGLQGYGNALSQAQMSSSTSSMTGASISTLIGSANKYAFGQGFSASAQATQKWWDQRVQSSFDFVYVPNVDLKTGKPLELNINITQEIPIDYHPLGRKVFYDHDHQNHTKNELD